VLLDFSGGLNVQIAHVQRVVFDELAPWFDHVTHQDGEHPVGVHGIGLV
jgi:hypothetical protein